MVERNVDSVCLGRGVKEWLLSQRKVLAACSTRQKAGSVAIAHNLLVVIYHVLNQGKPYQERGAPVLDERQRRKFIRHHTRCLGRLGVSAGFSTSH
jgi:hypothetical protein